MYKGISLALDILATIFLVLAFSMALLRKKHKQSYSAYIIAIICSVSAMLVSDIVYVCFAKELDPYSVNVAFVSETVYLAANILVIYYWADYIGRLILETDKLRQAYHLIYTAVMICNMILLFLNLFINIVFRIDERGQYSETMPGIIVFTALNYISILAVVVTIFRYKDKLKDGKSYYLLLLFQIPSVIGEVLMIIDDKISFVCGYAISAVLVLEIFERYSSYREIDQVIDYAIKHDNFEVYYQPIYSVRDKRFVCCEALMRLYDEKKGAVAPARLVEAAEETGKIHTIGKNNFYKICDFIASPEFEELGIDWVNINMSMKEMEIENVTGRILSVLKRKEISPSKICLELTETTFSNAEDIIARNMEELNDAGISVALDDFGQGHSNLYRMFLLPFKMVKLDQFLVQRMDTNKARAIIESVITLLKKLNYKIVAEAVENEGQLNYMKELGVDYIQGFYYARPMPRDKFIEFMKAQKQEQNQ